jgi:hypothetical protein
MRDILCGVPHTMGITSNRTEKETLKYRGDELPPQLTPSMEAFIDSLRKKSTRSTYKRGIDLFAAFYGKDIDAILEERKGDLTPRPNESLVDGKQRADRYEARASNLDKVSWLTFRPEVPNNPPPLSASQNSARKTACLTAACCPSSRPRIRPCPFAPPSTTQKADRNRNKTEFKVIFVYSAAIIPILTY